MCIRNSKSEKIHSQDKLRKAEMRLKGLESNPLMPTSYSSVVDLRFGRHGASENDGQPNDDDEDLDNEEDELEFSGMSFAVDDTLSTGTSSASVTESCLRASALRRAPGDALSMKSSSSISATMRRSTVDRIVRSVPPVTRMQQDLYMNEVNGMDIPCSRVVPTKRVLSHTGIGKTTATPNRAKEDMGLAGMSLDRPNAISQTVAINRVATTCEAIRIQTALRLSDEQLFSIPRFVASNIENMGTMEGWCILCIRREIKELVMMSLMKGTVLDMTIIPFRCMSSDEVSGEYDERECVAMDMQLYYTHKAIFALDHEVADYTVHPPARGAAGSGCMARVKS
jgi:hypothetical protein